MKTFRQADQRLRRIAAGWGKSATYPLLNYRFIQLGGGQMQCLAAFLAGIKTPKSLGNQCQGTVSICLLVISGYSGSNPAGTQNALGKKLMNGKANRPRPHCGQWRCR